MPGIIITNNDCVRTICFDRPLKLNTLLLEDLETALDGVQNRPSSTRALVFTGTGERAFSAGINLETFLLIAADPEAARVQIGAVNALLDAVRTAEIPTIAAINGLCLGGAFELAMACDFRIATSGSLIGLPEIKLGLPCILESALLQQYVGLNMAKEMILTGELYTADHLAPYGLLSLVSDIEALTQAVEGLLQKLAMLSPIGLASQKRLFEVWQNHGLKAANSMSVDEIVEIFKEPETQERLVSYNEELRRRTHRLDDDD